MLKAARRTADRSIETARVLAYHGARPISRRRPSGRKRVVFHIGLRKCGSTAIQETFRENAASLVPHVGLSGQRLPIRSTALATAAMRFLRNGTRIDRLHLVMEVERFERRLLEAPQQVVVVSDETILGHRLGYRGRDLFDAGAELLSIIERAAPYLDLHWVGYHRNQDRWYDSCWNQDVKRHGFTGAFDAWLAENRLDDDIAAGFRRMAADLAHPFRIIAMEDEIGGGSFLGATLLREAGVEPDLIRSIRPSQVKNTSLGSSALAFMRCVNGAEDLPAWCKRRIGILARNNPDLFAS